MARALWKGSIAFSASAFHRLKLHVVTPRLRATSSAVFPLLIQCEAIPRTLNLLAQSAGVIAARSDAASIDPHHVRQAIKLVPSAHAKSLHP